MKHVQLELFYHKKTEIEEVKEEIECVNKSFDNLRKGLFKRQSEICHQINSMQAQLQEIQLQVLMIEKYLKKLVTEISLNTAPISQHER